MKEKRRKIGLFQAETNAEFDTSLRMIGGLVIFAGIVISMFVGDFFFEKTYLTPEILHSLLATVGMWIMYHKGKSDGIGINGHSEPPKPLVAPVSPYQPKPEPEQEKGKMRLT